MSQDEWTKNKTKHLFQDLFEGIWVHLKEKKLSFFPFCLLLQFGSIVKLKNLQKIYLLQIGVHSKREFAPLSSCLMSIVFLTVNASSEGLDRSRKKIDG